MHIDNGQPVPSSIALLHAIRQTCTLFGILAFLVGMLACIDALRADIKTPNGELHTYPGAAVLIKGTIPPEAPNGSIVIRTESTALRPENVTYSRSLLTRSLSWSAVVDVYSDATPGLYNLYAGPSIGALTPLAWSLHIYPDEASLLAASPSLCLRQFGLDPVRIALYTLTSALCLGTLALLLWRLSSRLLKRRGFCRIYYARTEGDDTLLYCIDQEHLLRMDRSYPVFSAAGQLLGLAGLTGRSPRYCVLTLCAAQARAGCLISFAGETLRRED